MKKKPLVQDEIYHGKLITLRTDIYEDEQKYDVILHPGAVAMIPILPNGDLVFVKQYRQAAEEELYEIPAGTLEKGEKPYETAQRELQEEIGYKSQNMTPLFACYSAPGFSSEYIYFFLAKDLEKSVLIAEDTDEIEVIEVSLEKANQMIKEKKLSI